MELYFGTQTATDGTIAIDGAEARHLSRVMRHRSGDRVFVTDGCGVEREVELVTFGLDRVTARVISTRERPREPRCRLALAQAALKGGKLAQVCEQVTELGVAEFIPLLTRRTVGRFGEARRTRLRTVMRAALKSSTGTLLPELQPETDLTGLERRFGDYDQVLVAYEEESMAGISDILRPGVASVLVVVGPEGGFEPAEIAEMVGVGAKVFSLGPRRLRAETAAIAAVSALLLSLGDLGGRRGSDNAVKGGGIEAW